MPKNKGKFLTAEPKFSPTQISFVSFILTNNCLFAPLGKGGKNRRRGKNENETEKRELVFKEDGQGKSLSYKSLI